MKPVRLPRDPLSLQAPSPTFIDSHGDWHELELEHAAHVTIVVDAAVEAGQVDALSHLRRAHIAMSFERMR